MGNIREHMHFYNEGATEVQRTLRWPIALYLNLVEDIPPNRSQGENYAIFQRSRMGRTAHKEVAVLELSGLPCKSMKRSDWRYAEFGIKYDGDFLEKRAKLLKKLVTQHRPSLVIFYCTGPRLAYWESVCGCRFNLIVPAGTNPTTYYWAENDATFFCAIPQGAQGQISYVKIEEFAEHIRPNFLARPSAERVMAFAS
jgi:hypothetical protein